MKRLSVDEFMRRLTVVGWLHVTAITGTTNRTQAVVNLRPRDRSWVMSRSEYFQQHTTTRLTEPFHGTEPPGTAVPRAHPRSDSTASSASWPREF